MKRAAHDSWLNLYKTRYAYGQYNHIIIIIII